MKKWWEKANLFFYELTKENWGFPYHILFSLIISQVSIILMYRFTGLSLPRIIFFTWILINIIGLINEAIQHEDSKEVFQDMLGNNIGWLIGSILIYLI